MGRRMFGRMIGGRKGWSCGALCITDHSEMRNFEMRIAHRREDPSRTSTLELILCIKILTAITFPAKALRLLLELVSKNHSETIKCPDIVIHVAERK